MVVINIHAADNRTSKYIKENFGNTRKNLQNHTKWK